jgi:hypothetical protein
LNFYDLEEGMHEKYGFHLIEEREIKEIHSRAMLYEHKATKAGMLSIVNDDPNKVFGISFRTPPKDSTGVAHILEHSVLCGSRRYPVKEPFVELLKGSLQTFLNAFTYPDRTCYPVASLNEQDFHNLVNVYLDAVFHPRITPEIFHQEGWHYEFPAEDPGLAIQGVVYNEMKGVYSSPHGLLAETCQHSLFPDTLYGLDSGGDPEVIPSLKYEDFKAFHQAYYHPTNSWIFFYGNDDQEARFRLLAAYLDEYEFCPVESGIPLQPHIPEDRKIVRPYPAGQEQGPAASMACLNWLLPESADLESNLCWSIADNLLIGMPGSPLRRALIESGLGEDIVGGGLDKDLRQMTYSVGLSGVRPGNESAVQELIQKTLARVVDRGFDPDLVEAGINRLEFGLRENNTGSLPRGLVVMIRSLKSWIYDRSPFLFLEFEEALESIKSRAAKGEKIFESLTAEHLVKNKHKTFVVLEPDPDLERKKAEEEKAGLAAARRAMTQEDVLVFQDALGRLRAFQETPDSPEDLATIPMLSRADVDPAVKKVPHEISTMHKVMLHMHDLETNGIAYLTLGLDLRTVPRDLLPLLPVFGQALLEMGNKDEDYVRFSTRIRQKTGGLSAGPMALSVLGQDKCRAFFSIQAKATRDKARDMLVIIHDLLTGTDFNDPARFKQIVLEARAGLEQSLIPAGHSVVLNRLGSWFGEANWLSDQFHGVEQLNFLRRLSSRLENDWEGVLADLCTLRQVLVGRAGMFVSATMSQEVWSDVEGPLGEFLQSLPERSAEAEEWNRPLVPVSEALIVPAQVNYVGRVVPLRSTGYGDHGAAHVAVKLLKTSWLWEQVRVRGGAYGAFCLFDRINELLTFGSYRDPNIFRTAETFARSADFLAQSEIGQEELDKAVIGTIGDMDSPKFPDAEGLAATLRSLMGLSDEKRQQIRDEVLSASREDLVSFGRALEDAARESVVSVLGSAGAVDRAEAEGLRFEQRINLL